MRLGTLSMLLVACGPEGPTGDDPVGPSCDGQLQDGEGAVADASFDKDGDGYVDGADPGCRASYGANRLDCDDADDALHPGQGEVGCNGLDDDCNPDTEDAHDADGDAVLACDDCDDLDPGRFPGNEERCWDDVDNDCDGLVDPGCGPDYNGTFAITPPVVHECRLLGIPFVDVDFGEVDVAWLPPRLILTSAGSPQPGALEGTFDPATGEFALALDVVLGTPASCDEYYAFVGRFTDPDHFTMTFTARYDGFCGRCGGTYAFPDLAGVRILDGG
jgi:hypothetical protein